MDQVELTNYGHDCAKVDGQYEVVKYRTAQEVEQAIDAFNTKLLRSLTLTAGRHSKKTISLS